MSVRPKQIVGHRRERSENRPDEEQFRREHGDFAILKEQRAGVVRPLPLRVLRERIQTAAYAQDTLFNAYDPDDWGGCGCANDFEP